MDVCMIDRFKSGERNTLCALFIAKGLSSNYPALYVHEEF